MYILYNSKPMGSLFHSKNCNGIIWKILDKTLSLLSKLGLQYNLTTDNINGKLFIRIFN